MTRCIRSQQVSHLRPESRCSVTSISGNHLMEVVNRLSSGSYVEAVRGKGGGMHFLRVRSGQFLLMRTAIS